MTTARIRPATSPFLAAVLAVGVCCASLATPRAAHAAASAGDAAAAQALFDESKKLMASKQFSAARPKLEESERLDPSPSTEFYLADCYQQLGKTASAWALFLQVASESKAAGRPEREQFARKRADDLAPRLSRLTVAVPAGSHLDGLQIKRDGEFVGAGQWGTPLPIDPGKHSLVATAPGRLDWRQDVDVPADGKTTTVEVPQLARDPVAVTTPIVATTPPAETSPAPSPSATHDGMSSRKVAALIVGGAGVVAVGVGGVFGLEAISKNSDSKANGCNGNVCNAAGFATRHDAQTDATISDVLMGVGAAALVGGVVLWIIAPSSIEERAQAGGNPSNVGLRLSPTGVFLTGAFE